MDIVDKIIYKKISEIRPYARNARNNEKTISLLTQIIPKVGFNVPIVIDEKGVIVKGHARYIAAIRLDMDEVPCVVTHASEDDVKLNRLADNLVSEFSEWLTDELLDELKELNIDFDMNELALPDFRSTEEFDNTDVVEAIPDDADDEEVHEQKPQIKYYRCRCPKCGNLEFRKANEVEKENE